MKYKYPLASPSWGIEEINSIHKVIDSGNFTMGVKVKEFEKKFCASFGSKYALMTNSGSSANLLMVASLFYTQDERFKLKRGDEVIVPAVSWSTSYIPLYQYGLKLKFVDIDLETLNYDLQSLEKAITKKTRLILIVNLLGNPNEFKKINEFINMRNKKVFLIEDNCESLGAKYEKKYCGNFGLMASHSSFFSHHISTMEGGIITTNNEELYHILLSLRAHGWTRDLPNENKICKKYPNNKFEENFRFILPGYNLRPIEFSGAIGIEQLKKFTKFLKVRRKNAKKFKEIFEGNSNFIIQKEIGESSWFGFSLIIKKNSNLNRIGLIEKLDKLGIEYRPIVSGNFIKNEVIKYFDYEIFGDLNNANYLDKNGLFIGNHHYPIEDKIMKLKYLF